MSRKSKVTDDQILSGLKRGLTNKQIAEDARVSIGTIQRRLAVYGGNPNYLNAHRKSSTEELIQICLRASEIGWAALAKELKISYREMMNIKTRAVKRGLFRRENGYKSKDKRRKKKWSGSELAIMLKWSGIISRNEIAKKLGATSGRVIKERLLSMNIAGRDVNGILISRFREYFGCEPPRFVSSTTGPGGSMKYKLALWVDIEYWISARLIKSTPLITTKIKTMALFQKWIWGGGGIKIWREIHRGIEGQIIDQMAIIVPKS